MLPTHETFEAMAAAIFKAAEDPDFPGIVPFDHPATLLIGYIKAAPRSQRTEKDQWSCPIQDIKKGLGAVDPETHRRLQALVERARSRWSSHG